MQDYEAYPKRLLAALIEKADEKTLGLLVQKLRHETKGDEKAFLDLLLTRGGEGEKAVLSMIPGLSAEAELHLAETDVDLPPAVVAKLASSKRKRTLSAIVTRSDLTETAALKLAKNRDSQIARAAKSSSVFPSSERIRLYREGEGDPGAWVKDPAFLEAFLADQVERVRSTPTTARALDWTLSRVPPGELDEKSTSHVTELVTLYLERGEPGPVLSYLRRLPAGRTAAAVLDVVTREEHLEKYPTLLKDAAYHMCEDRFPRAVLMRLPHRFPKRWFDAESVDSAWIAGGAMRLLALSHPGLSAVMRTESVLSGTSEEQVHAAHNPRLGPEEVEHLLEVLPEGERWRLIEADLTPEQRKRVYLDGSALSSVVFTIRVRKVELDVSAWLTEELCLHALSNREAALDGSAAGYGRFASLALRRYPDLGKTILENLRPSDRIPASVARHAAEAALPDLTDPAVLETFCGLLPSWNGGVADLLEAARMVGKT